MIFFWSVKVYCNNYMLKFAFVLFNFFSIRDGYFKFSSILLNTKKVVVYNKLLKISSWRKTYIL